MKGATYTPPEKVETPVVPAKPARKGKQRAREEDGQFKADDPATPEANEAWAEPKE